jgi:hypothetical protein
MGNTSGSQNITFFNGTLDTSGTIYIGLLCEKNNRGNKGSYRYEQLEKEKI